MYLSSEQMEVLSRGGGIHHMEIDIRPIGGCLALGGVTQLEESLDATRTVLGTGAVKPMGQHHDETALA